MWKIKVKVIRSKLFGCGNSIQQLEVKPLRWFSAILRTTSHRYRISFLNTTRVRPCEKLHEDLSGFDPVKYKEVLDGTLNPDYLVDIIGQICEISHIEHINVNGKETKKLSLELRNTYDERLPMVLWGKFACDVSEAMQDRDDHSTIFVLRFGKIKVSVSNAYNVSEIGLNPPMIEVGKFIARSCFVYFKVEKCILLCTITAIDSDMGWFYLSCKVCSKKVLSVLTSTNDDDNDDDDLKYTYYCVKCNTFNPLTLPSNTKLLVFDNHAMQLLNQPCLQIAGSSIKFEIEETNVLPPTLNNIIGKTFLFKIQIERENFVYKHETYKVLKVITNKDLISDFEQSNSLNGSASEQSESNDLTPAKRIRPLNIDFKESFDENSVSRSMSFVQIKKNKFAKGG
ncbi:hypothetical protein N665_0070s0021 [Sinapis alba]|nr:hypothetical protein N665_0070s0021 [Sinapis alba]